MNVSIGNLSTVPTNSPQWSYLALFLIPMFTVWGNVLVCLSVRLEKRLQNRFNYFLVSLAMSDLLCAVLVMPVSAWKMIRGGDIPEVPREFCLVWYSLDVFFTASTIIHLCTISTDRYLALKNPLRYHSTKRRSSLILKICIAWCVPFGIACPLFIFARKLDHETHAGSSFKGCGPHNVYFILTATVVTFVLPLCIMVVTYFLTISTIITQTRRAQQNLHGRRVFTPLIVYRRDTPIPAQRELQSSPTVVNLASGTGHITPTSASSPDDLGDCSKTTNNIHKGTATVLVNGYASGTTGGTTTVLCYGSRYLQKHTVRHCLSSPTIPMKNACSITTGSVEDQRSRHSAPLVEQDHVSSASIVSIYTNQHNNNTNLATSSARRFLSVPGSSSGYASLVRRLSRRFSTPSLHSNTDSCKHNKATKVMNYIHKGKKAVQVLGILFILFLVCYLPFFVTYLLDFFCTSCSPMTAQLVPKMEWIGYSASMLNPIVYHIFNVNFRRTFHRIMRCNCQKVKLLPQTGSPYT